MIRRLGTRPVAIALVCSLTTLGMSSGPSTALSADRFMQHVRYLASDALRGRGNGTAELDIAAAYLATEFRRLGLEPLGDRGSFLQRFPLATDSVAGSHACQPASAFSASGQRTPRPPIASSVSPL